MTDQIPPTELMPKHHNPIDSYQDKHMFEIMISSHAEATDIINKVLEKILKASTAIYDHLKFNKKGRIIYVGAGTSGRIAVQDGVELYPTFGWPKKRVEFLIAGGLSALSKTIENAEDNVKDAIIMCKKLSINSEDVIIALAASGSTPFTTKVLEFASNAKSLTIGISNNPLGKILIHADHKIILNTGPEVILGSTRLKAGTAQKICLNMMSSFVMIKFGRVKNGEMTHLVASNKKLKLRKKRMLSNTGIKV